MEPEDRHDDFDPDEGQEVEFTVRLEMWSGSPAPTSDELQDLITQRAVTPWQHNLREALVREA